MSKFRQQLEHEYDADPMAAGGLADRACRLVRVGRSWWRGHRKIEGGKITLEDGKVVAGAAVSDPRWNLMPADVKKEYTALEGAVTKVLEQYAVGGVQSDDTAAMSAMVGNGVYLVDTAAWPRVKTLLDAAADKWAKAADALCTEDGYEELLRLIDEKVGDEVFTIIRPLIPQRHQLRNKFCLMYRVLPVRMAPDVEKDADPDVASGRRAVVIEALEAVVRGPRVRLAEACAAFSNLLIEYDETGWAVARFPMRSGKAIARSVRKDSLLAVLNAVDDFKTYQRFSDPILDEAVEALENELPSTNQDDVLTIVQRELGDNNEAAVRVGTKAAAASNAAMDEEGMCFALGAALRS